MPILMYFTQQGFLCRPLNAIVSKDVGIEPRTAKELAITATFHQMHISHSRASTNIWTSPTVVSLKTTRTLQELYKK